MYVEYVDAKGEILRLASHHDYCPQPGESVDLGEKTYLVKPVPARNYQKMMGTTPCWVKVLTVEEVNKPAESKAAEAKVKGRTVLKG